MGFGIYSSIAGANVREIELEVLANNIANIQTTGYKEMQVSFTSELDKNMESDENQELQTFVREGKSHVNFAPGSIFATGNPLDVAIQGEGFFEIQTAAGLRYTRNGNFTINQEGTVTTQGGDIVLAQEGQINVPANKQVAISPSGEITVDGEILARLKVVDFADRGKLKKEGANHYVADGLETKAVQEFSIAQGHLENSNVDLIRNLTRIIEVSRAYESHQKSMTKQIESSQQLSQIAKMS